MIYLKNLETVIHPDRAGYVFLAKSEDSSRYRLGYTQDLTKRKKQLRANNESGLHIVKYFYTPNAIYDKDKLRTRFSQYHTHNDWYEANHIDNLSPFCSYTWHLAKVKAAEALESLGVKKTEGLQEALSLFIQPLRKIGTPKQLEKLDYSLYRIQQLIQQKGDPQRVAMSFLAYPKTWEPLFDRDTWVEHYRTSYTIECLQQTLKSFSERWNQSPLSDS